MLINKHFIFLLMNSYLCLSELTISPSSKLVINEGQPLKITCAASESIDFFYPKNISKLAATSPISVNEISANGTTKLILSRSKTVYGDTGYYGCIEASKNQRKLNLRDIYVTPETYDEIAIKWTYVYVKSEIHGFVTNFPIKLIDSSIGSDVVMPCRPTSPDDNVTISYFLNNTSTTLSVSEKLTYDSKIGFTFHDGQVVNKRHYYCRVEKPQNDLIIIEASVSHPSKQLGLGIYTDTLQHLTVGEDFPMNCSITRREIFTDDVFFWTTPRKSHTIAKFMKELTPSGKNIYKSELMIKNVTNDDVGEYKCHFYGSGSIQVVKANLQLHVEEYLNVSMKHLLALNGMKIEFGDTLDRWIRIFAYPLPTFKWLDPEGNQISNNWTPQFYSLNGGAFWIRLQKTKLTFKDEGNHTLIITSSAGKQNFTFFIGISVKPKIIKPDIIPVVDVSQDDPVSGDCKAKGKPMPSIAWGVTKQFKNLTEQSPKNSSFEISSISDGINKTISTIKFKAQRTGKVICQACNEAGCVFSVIKIINVPVSMELQPKVTSTFKEISLNVGEPLTINCRSTKKITFFYPKFDKKVVTSQENITTRVTDNGHTAKFERRKTVYRDSGWYGCANLPEKYKMPNQSNFPFTPDIYNESDVQWIYVFVKSAVHLFVDTPFFPQDKKGKYYVDGKVGNDVLLPCRASSMDYKVTLYSDDKVIDTEYDTKKGMLIRNLKADGPFEYSCIIVLDSGVVERMNFKIRTPGQRTDFEKPIISTRSPAHMEIGGTYNMDCLIPVWGNKYYFLAWVTPRTTNRIFQNTGIISSSSEEVIKGKHYALSQLTIDNVTSDDFGDYECRYYKYASIETAKVTLTPHKRKHLDVSISVPNGRFSIGDGNASILLVHVDAYPIPEFHWYNPKRKELPTPKKFDDFEVNSEHFNVDLSEYQFSLDDMGTIMFVANNSAGIRTITFDVVVYSKPTIVGLIDRTSYLMNEEAKFTCLATGNPVPNIMWSYLDENNNLVQNKFIQDTKTGPNIGKVSSTIKVKITRAGSITCKATNKYGEDSFDGDFVIEDQTTVSSNLNLENTTLNGKPGLPQADAKNSATRPKNPDGKDQTTSTEPPKTTAKPEYIDPNRLGSVIKKMNVTKGSNIKMECSASITESPDDLKWYNTTNLLKTDGRVAIIETKAAPLYSSQLTISDVKEWDEGDYTCEGTIGGSTVKNQYHVHVNASALFSASILLQLSIMLLSYFM